MPFDWIDVVFNYRNSLFYYVIMTLDRIDVVCNYRNSLLYYVIMTYYGLTLHDTIQVMPPSSGCLSFI